MAKDMNIPVLGIVENFSYLECPDCGRKIEVFGKSHIEDIAKELEIPVLRPDSDRSEADRSSGKRSL